MGGVNPLEDPAKRFEVSRRALAILERHHGEDNVEVTSAMRNMVGAWADIGDYVMARATAEQVLAVSERYYGRDDIEVSIDLRFDGCACMHCGDYAAAKSAFEREGSIIELHCGHNCEEHFEYVSNIVVKACAEVFLGRLDHAGALARRAADLGVGMQGNAEWGKMAMSLAGVLEASGYTEEGEMLFQNGLASFDSYLLLKLALEEVQKLWKMKYPKVAQWMTELSCATLLTLRDSCAGVQPDV